MHILVTGSQGGIGSRLTPLLREAGHTVRSHSQGVRETSYTFWCVTSDGQITDLWFS